MDGWMDDVDVLFFARNVILREYESSMHPRVKGLRRHALPPFVVGVGIFTVEVTHLLCPTS